MDTGQNAVWVLMGSHFGDNQQMLALANATARITGAEVLCKKMHFSTFNFLPNARAGGSLTGLSASSQGELSPPWPRMIITSGRRAVPAALWVRAQAGGRVRLVHIGRPWTPLSRFDLVITTAQYELPLRENVLHNLMPLSEAAWKDDSQTPQPEHLSALPRPWLAVGIGGSSAPYRLDSHSARRLTERCSAFIKETGGSALLLAGPRSQERVLSILQCGISGPHRLFPWGPGLPHFHDIAPHADKILITGDSAALMADAAVTGKPVEICPLRWDPPIRYAMVHMIRPLLPKSLFADLISAGLITSVRNMPAFGNALTRAGLLAGGPAAANIRAQELNQSALRCAALLAPYRAPDLVGQIPRLQLGTGHA